MRKGISVVTNDPTQSTRSLTISGPVKRLYTISRRSISLRGPVGRNITQTITITPEADYRFKITEAKMEHGRNAGLTWNAQQIQSRTVYQIRVTNLRKDAGGYSDTIRLKTDSDILPEIRISVHGNIKDLL